MNDTARRVLAEIDRDQRGEDWLDRSLSDRREAREAEERERQAREAKQHSAQQRAQNNFDNFNRAVDARVEEYLLSRFAIRPLAKRCLRTSAKSAKSFGRKMPSLRRRSRS